ncbi:hypothetical protein [Burkholderia stabilis]
MHPFDSAIVGAPMIGSQSVKSYFLSQSFASESDWADSMRLARSTQWPCWMAKTLSPGMSRGIYRD